MISLQAGETTAEPVAVATEELESMKKTDLETDALLCSFYKDENHELKHKLECTRYELGCTRHHMFQLDEKLQEVQQERARLVKRVTGLFSKLHFL